MNKVYTAPISSHAVDAFFKQSVSNSDTKYQIKQVQDPYICLFLLFEDFTSFSTLKFKGNLTEISLKRAFRVIDRLDVLLPKETPENVANAKKALLGLLESNEALTLSAQAFNESLPNLRADARIWSDQGVAEFFITAFDFTIELNLNQLEQLKIGLASVAHEDPQADYEQALKVKRETDLEIDKDIYFRPQGNGKNNPTGLLLGFIGANQFKAFEPLSPTEKDLIEIVFKRRFPRSGLEQQTDTNSLGKIFKTEARAINKHKSRIDNKTKKHLAKPLFSLDTSNNLTFTHSFTCMHPSLRAKQQMQQQF